MNLKKIIPALLFAMSMAFVSPAIASVTSTTPVETPKEVMKREIETRLLEIKKMDKTNLSAEEKKELKDEVKALKKKAKTNGIYLSVGAIIIIVLLLILIF